jgi:2-succinyl-6-hydroxy-2,4-cyclohexadiene-1-carboxylate synthase
MGVEAFLEEWTALPLFAGLEPEMRFMTQRRTNTAAGLASSLRLAGTGAQEPVWSRLGSLAMPTLLMTGANDTKFTAIAERMAALIGPSAHLAVVPGAGHTAHLEQAWVFGAIVRTWLGATDPVDQAERNNPAANSTPNTS